MRWKIAYQLKLSVTTARTIYAKDPVFSFRPNSGVQIEGSFFGIQAYWRTWSGILSPLCWSIMKLFWKAPS